MDMKGKCAIVTGSSSGVGEATALMLAQRGASVLVNCTKSVAAAESVAVGSGGNGRACRGPGARTGEMGRMRVSGGRNPAEGTAACAGAGRNSRKADAIAPATRVPRRPACGRGPQSQGAGQPGAGGPGPRPLPRGPAGGPLSRMGWRACPRGL